VTQIIFACKNNCCLDCIYHCRNQFFFPSLGKNLPTMVCVCVSQSCNIDTRTCQSVDISNNVAFVAGCKWRHQKYDTKCKYQMSSCELYIFSSLSGFDVITTHCSTTSMKERNVYILYCILAFKYNFHIKKYVL